jgi:general secretion pathway protein G
MLKGLPMHAGSRLIRGFSLLELIVVLAILALLVSLISPRFVGSLESSKEASLKANLAIMRQTLDRYYSDRGRYPDNFEQLVSERYLRGLPIDPMTESDTTWVAIGHPAGLPGIYDIKSGSAKMGFDKRLYNEW